MTSRKLVRRVMCAAAVSSAALANGMAQIAVAFEDAAAKPAFYSGNHPSPKLKPVPSGSQSAEQVFTATTAGTQNNTRIQRVQFQPNVPYNGANARNQAASQPGFNNPPATVGQQVPNNPMVVNELNRLFKENGQQPPSMLQQDLPNAGNPQMNMVRSKQQPPTSPQKTVQQSSQPSVQQPPQPKKNVFQKLVGRLRGEPKAGTATMNPSSSGGQGLSTLSAPAPNSIHSDRAPSAPQVPPGIARVPPVPPSNSGTVRSAASPQMPVVNGSRSGSSVAAGQKAVVAPNPGVVQMRPAAVPAARSLPGQNSSAPKKFVQPGTAPSFIQPHSVVQQQAVPSNRAAGSTEQPQVLRDSAQPSTIAVTKTNPVPPAARPLPAKSQPGDDFVDPFAVTPNSDSEEVLDLDSLIEIPAARASQTETDRGSEAQPDKVAIQPRPTPAAVTTSNPFSEAAGEIGVTGETGETSAEPLMKSPAGSQQNSAAEGKTLPESSAESAPAPVEGNPFTGVRLDVSDEQFFEDTTGRAFLDDASTDRDAEKESDIIAGQPLPPVEDFDSSLPALPLPTVDEISNTAVAAERQRQAAEHTERDRRRALIESRAGQTGFKGFCPVELRDQRELSDANPAFTAVFGLQTYSFSSARAKAAFESDPSRYAPAAGGSDIVLLVNSGEEQPGMLDYSLWYRDRLYMFRSRETMALFSRDPSRFASEY